MTNSIMLHGRIRLQLDIEILSGLHIGGAAAGLEIGGVDKPVIRNPLSQQPYIPGSSLKGKMRSLMEKAYGAPQNRKINTILMHLAKTNDEYQNFPISKIFGTLPENDGFVTKTPTRLTVRDACLQKNSAEALTKIRTDLPYTEVKWEAAIDRVTSAATPRQIERVPAGAIFGPAELIYSIYTGNGEDVAEVVSWFRYVLEALGHVEDDYLGGMGSRGNGQVQFTNLKVTAKRATQQGYETISAINETAINLAALHNNQLIETLKAAFVTKG
jgi:CRISPR-associated protein Csm3